MKLVFTLPIIKKVTQTLSFFEIPLEYQFLVLDYHLKDEMKMNDKKQLIVGNNAYDKIVLCPLIMDFGRKNISEGLFYKYTPKSPIANQVGDLLYAIRTYYRFDVMVKDNKMFLTDEIDLEDGKREKLFEIYPFMGLNTQNYDKWEDIEKVLKNYFDDFKKDDAAQERRNKLWKKMGKLDSNMYNKTDGYYFNIFAGIKVYPQLGFDPYPKNSKELYKVKRLYKYCIDKRIPITTHCSDGGFKSGNNDKLTSPLTKWKNVLETEEFKTLTLNFAHFGSQKDKQTEWQDAIIELTKQYPNVYTDISCNDMSEKYYKDLENLFTNKNPQLHERVLFGSDFSINMLVTDAKSYNEYLETFVDYQLPHQTDMCENNPERFLFGGEIHNS